MEHKSKVTPPTLRAMKERGERIAMLTAYDATFAHLLDESGIDILLVGDSAGMVVGGHENTLPVTMDEMVYHCRAVARGTRRAQVVGDMPFMSYQVSVEEGVRNAGRLVKEGGAEAVKIEGAGANLDLVSRLTGIGIPVMGHVGLTPQSVHAVGGFKVQGRDAATRQRILDDARALEQAGCYAVVLESVPSALAEEVTSSLTVPTIGIGAGPGCDGQVLVIYDMLGLNDAFRPRFVKRFDQLGLRVRTAVKAYIDEVKDGLFPTEEHSFSATPAKVVGEGALYGAVGAPRPPAPAAPDPEPEPASADGPRLVSLPACGWPRSIDEK